MLSGLSIPVGVGPDGRALIDTGDKQLTKIIGLHLSFSDSENPFQDIGIDQVIFDVNDSRLQPLMRYRLNTLFDSLEADQRAKLDQNSIRFESVNEELFFYFKYWNLETNEPIDFRGTVDLIGGRIIPT